MDIAAPTSNSVTFKRWSGLEMVAIVIFTCGIGGLFVGYQQYKALKEVNPEALDPLVAIALQIVGLLLTGGILTLVVEYMQTNRLVAASARANPPGRNHNLMLVVMGAHVAGMLSLWGSWTGVLAVTAFAFQIYAMWTVQKELELHTVAA